MEKKRVSVQIEGRNYVVITSDDPAYVHAVAGEVTAGIRKAAQTGRHLSTRDCAIITAMNFCDDVHRAEQKNKDVAEKANQIIRQSGETGRQTRELKEKLTGAINENTALTKRIRALEDQLHTLIKENEQLKKAAESKPLENEKKFEQTVRDKKTEKLMGYVPMRQYSLFEEEGGQASAPNQATQAIQNSQNHQNNKYNPGKKHGRH